MMSVKECESAMRAFMIVMIFALYYKLMCECNTMYDILLWP